MGHARATVKYYFCCPARSRHTVDNAAVIRYFSSPYVGAPFLAHFFPSLTKYFVPHVGSAVLNGLSATSTLPGVGYILITVYRPEKRRARSNQTSRKTFEAIRVCIVTPHALVSQLPVLQFERIYTSSSG